LNLAVTLFETQKAPRNMTTVISHFNADTFLGDVGDDICSPFFDKSGNMFVVCQDSGEILSVNAAGNIESIHSTGGQPSGSAYDNSGVLFVADIAHGAVLAVQRDGQQDVVVGVYEDRPMLGPNSICITSAGIFFTDSGPFGETGLHNKSGSIYTIANSPSGQILKPIALNTLAYPSGIAVGLDGSLYVCEMMKNRVLRYFQQPEGVYHGSVFYQLTGSVGPSAIAIDGSGNLYIAQYDTRGKRSPALYTVVSHVC
jgi:sugar lactone lactonase YvrE